MIKKPTRDLGEEHGAITLMLLIMGKIADKLHEGQPINKEHLNRIVEFIRNFTDRCHHAKEEVILFPALLKQSLNKKLVNELLGEHKAGRDYIRGIAESIDSCQPGNPDAIHIAVNARGYIQLLTEHIRKENIVLFPIADKELSEKAQKDIEKKFQKLEKDVIGLGKHEEYHGWLNELKKIYL